MNSTTALHPPQQNSGLRKLQGELHEALGMADKQQLKDWGIRSAKRFGTVFVKRVTNLGSLLSKLTSATADEIFNALRAMGDGRLSAHMTSRGNTAATALKAMQAAAARTSSAIANGLNRNPAESATQLFSAVVGFYAGSGGDGNGGIPDLDLMAGIGAHRSIFTHSIIAGAFVETAVLSLVDLIEVIHKKLPADHDPLWDKLLKYQKLSSETFVTGASLGIATHLGIDTTIDGFTPYKDLPISLPLELHEALMGLNAVAEGTYGLHRLFDHHLSPKLNTYQETVPNLPRNSDPMQISNQEPDKLALPSSSRVDRERLRNLPAQERLEEAAILAELAAKKAHHEIDSLNKSLVAAKGKIDHAKQPLRLGVIGEFRAGKSTLINALLGEEVAFVDILEATPVECVFRYGEDRHTVFVYKDGQREKRSYAKANEKISDLRQDVAWISTVEYVEYFVPSPRLRQFDLWDAPGMGGGAAHQSVADSFLEKLGAAIWVFDATLLGKATIAAPLEKLRQSGKPVVAAINHIDEFTDDIEQAYVLLKKIYPDTFDSEVAFSAYYAFKDVSAGKKNEALEKLWGSVCGCVGISEKEGQDARVERAAAVACADLGAWVISARRDVQDRVGLLDHVRQNLLSSKQRLMDGLESILNEEAATVFKRIELELATTVTQLEQTPEVAGKIVEFFNDPRTQERITTEIFSLAIERANRKWRQYSDQAIDLSRAAVPLGNIAALAVPSQNEMVKNAAMEEAIYAGGVSFSVAAVVAAMTAVTWPAILVAIPIGSLAAWKKKRELDRAMRSVHQEFVNSIGELEREFVTRFLPKAAEEIEKSLDTAVEQLLQKQCVELLGELDDVEARTATVDLLALEYALSGATPPVSDMRLSSKAVLGLLQNPGARLDIYTPSIDFSLSPLLQCLPPDTSIRMVITSRDDDRQHLTEKIDHAFGNWQGNRKVFCANLPDGSPLPLDQTMLVTTDFALITDGSLGRLVEGVAHFTHFPNGRIAGQRCFGELWDGWSSAYGELSRHPVY